MQLKPSFSRYARLGRRRGRLIGVASAVAVAATSLVLWAPTPASAANCVTAANPIVCENALPGDPMSDWYTPNAYGEIAGFPDQISYQIGDTVNFKVQSPVSYSVTILRLGWYGGDGARIMDGSPTQTFPAITQPPCITDSSTGDTDCGNWSVTANWTVPSDAVSGVYVAELNQSDNGGEMLVPFVVRDNSSHSDIVVQTDDETWEAYNLWTGTDLYQGNGPALDGRAYAVSYNRPMINGGDNGVFGSEYAMIQWLERNGYNTSYLSGQDVSTNGSLLLNHKVFMSSGHDEYWTASQYQNVLAARAAGVDLAFFSGNEVFWKTRLAPSIDGSNTPNRTLITYKMTKMELKPPDGIADPSGIWTGTWMDPAGAGSGGNMPENQLTGSLFQVNGYRSDAMTVPAAYAQLPIWANTSVAQLQPGQVTTFPAGTLGYEWDSDVLNATRPQGEIDLSQTTVPITNNTMLLDYGNTYGNGTATHSLVMYRDPNSGALVFGSGHRAVVLGPGQRALDRPAQRQPARGPGHAAGHRQHSRAKWACSPARCSPAWSPATASTDTTGPNVTITGPSSGSSVACALAGHDHRHGSGHRRRRGRPGGGVRRWRQHLAARPRGAATRHRSAGHTPGPPPRRAR